MYCIDTEAWVFMFNGGSPYGFTINCRECEKDDISIHENQPDELDWLMNWQIGEKLFFYV